MTATSIEWTDRTWNPIRGCSRVSPGCDHCYAMGQAHRFSGPGKPFEGLTTIRKGKVDWAGRARFVPEMLDAPLRWKKPLRVFVNSMSDLFHESLSNEEIAAVFGVMAACPQHTFQVLTKRPKRTAEWFAVTGIIETVDKFKHLALAGRLEEYFAPERTAEVADWPGYLVTTRGRVLSTHGSETCLWCGKANEGQAQKRYCSKACRSKAAYERKARGWTEPPVAPREMLADSGESGHSRITLYRDDGASERPLVHRLVLSAFDRVSEPEEQACHINGDPSVNALWNLRWGSQSSNWDDSKRHGTRRRYCKLTPDQVDSIRAADASPAELAARFGVSDTQIRNIIAGRQWAPEPAIEWPLPGVWLGVSAEDQETYNARVPLLAHQIPAAVRWVSIEPQLGPIKLRGTGHIHLDWVVQGGESGPGARPFDVAWARSMRDECAESGIAYFLKQLGARVIDSSLRDVFGYGYVHYTGGPEDSRVLAAASRPDYRVVAHDVSRLLARDRRKGGDMAEWPLELRAREFPEART